MQRQKEAYDKVKEEQLQQKLNFEKVPWDPWGIYLFEECFW